MKEIEKYICLILLILILLISLLVYIVYKDFLINYRKIEYFKLI